MAASDAAHPAIASDKPFVVLAGENDPRKHPKKSMKHLPPSQSRQPAGKRATLRLARVPSDETDSDMSDDQPPPKRSKPEPTDSPTASDAEETQTEGSSLDSDDLSDGELSALIVPFDFLPSCEPNASNGAWACKEVGCGHVIPRADQPGVREEILTHIRSHVDVLERLVTRESRPDRPVTHLLEKLKGLEEKGAK